MSGALVQAFAVRVYYEDTVSSGRVYHGSFLRFLERGRTEWLRRLGVSQQDVAGSPGIFFVVRRLQIEFLAPALMDDALCVETCIPRYAGPPRSDFGSVFFAGRRNSWLQRCWWRRFAMAVLHESLTYCAANSKQPYEVRRFALRTARFPSAPAAGKSPSATPEALVPLDLEQHRHCKAVVLVEFVAEPSRFLAQVRFESRDAHFLRLKPCPRAGDARRRKAFAKQVLDRGFDELPTRPIDREWAW
jgi:YbgC/YbaW family acyl-CoA thioester hydrolase